MPALQQSWEQTSPVKHRSDDVVDEEACSRSASGRDLLSGATESSENLTLFFAGLSSSIASLLLVLWFPATDIRTS